jgi:CBS domain containing-hemolysin-like protein
VLVSCRHRRRPGLRSLHHALARLDAYLAACQLGITIASIGLGVVGEPAFESLLAPVLGPEADLGGIAVTGTLAFALITLLHVVVGELAPKSVAISRTTDTGLRVAPALRLFYLATKPLVDLFNGLGNLILRPFGIPPAREAGHAPHSESELLELLAQSGAEGLIEAEEQEIAERGFAFADRRAADVMQPREAIQFVSVGMTVADAAREAVTSGHRRLPVVDADRGLEAAVGLIHAHDLLAATLDGETTDVRPLLRPLAHVPRQTLVTVLLRRMLEERRHMVLVADEHARTVGLLRSRTWSRSWWERSRATPSCLRRRSAPRAELSELTRAAGTRQAAIPVGRCSGRATPVRGPGPPCRVGTGDSDRSSEGRTRRRGRPSGSSRG